MADFELLVVDDGSEDGTGDVVRGIDDPRIRYLRRPHAGLPLTLNAGLAEARAAVVAVQDADDWSAPQRLERQLAILDARPDVAVVGSRMPEVDAEGRELTARAPFEAGDVYHTLMRFNPISNPSSAYRREVVGALGGYDPRYGCAPEYDLWLRVWTATSSWPSTSRWRSGRSTAPTSRPSGSARASATRSICATSDAASAQPARPAIAAARRRLLPPAHAAQARPPAPPRPGDLAPGVQAGWRTRRRSGRRRRPLRSASGPITWTAMKNGTANSMKKPIGSV